MLWSVKPGEWQEVGLVIFNREHTPRNWFADWNQKEPKRWRGEMCRKDMKYSLFIPCIFEMGKKK